MTPQQAKTLRRLCYVILAAVLVLVWLLVVELQGVGQGGQSTISELMWRVWAEQPGVVFFLSHLFAAPFWILSAHWFWQSKSVYDAIRKGDK
jgi:hypothetical protein